MNAARWVDRKFGRLTVIALFAQTGDKRSSKPKLTKSERKLVQLERLLERRRLELADVNKYWQEEIVTIQRKNRMTQFQIDSIKKGEWPL